MRRGSTGSAISCQFWRYSPIPRRLTGASNSLLDPPTNTLTLLGELYLTHVPPSSQEQPPPLRPGKARVGPQREELSVRLKPSHSSWQELCGECAAAVRSEGGLAGLGKAGRRGCGVRCGFWDAEGLPRGGSGQLAAA